MLISFAISNYKSIKNKVSLSLNYSQVAPQGYLEHDDLYFTEVNSSRNGRVIPFMAIYGANASGKSNIISGVKSFQNFITTDLNSKEKPFPYTPYLLSNNCKIQPTEYEIILEKNKKIYKYNLSFNSEKIIAESFSRILTNGEENVIFDISKKIFNIKAPELYDLKTIYINECNYASAFLVKLATKYSGFSEDINLAYSFIKNDLEVYTDNNFHESFSVDKATITTNNDLSRALQKISRIISNLDISIESVNCNRSVDQMNKGDKIDVSPNQRVSWRDSGNNKIDVRFDSFNSVHKMDTGEYVKFDFLTQESYGTITLFGLLGVIIDVLTNGKTLIIDEIERSLHSEIVKYIIRMFRDKRVNKNKAQLICSTHDIYSMKDLKKTEISIVQKVNNLTELKPLYTYDVRNDLDFEKNYYTGRFGGMPKTIFDPYMLED